MARSGDLKALLRPFVLGLEELVPLLKHLLLRAQVPALWKDKLRKGSAHESLAAIRPVGK